MTKNNSAVRKALIPVAGKATRLMPVTSVIPKAMFPLVNGSDNIHCALHIILKETKLAGIEQVGIMAAPAQIGMLQRYFDAVKGKSSTELPLQIEYIIQKTPKGFGDAVLCGANFIGDEPFVLLLSDHVYIEDGDNQSCIAKVVKAFDLIGGVAMIGMQPVPAEELSKVGVAGGVKIQQNIYRCTAFIEKPNIQTARQRLKTNGLPKDTFLAHCGIYVFTPEIFDCLSSVSKEALKDSREVELAEAQAVLLSKYPEQYFLYRIAGRAYDIGTSAGYADAQAAFRKKAEIL